LFFGSYIFELLQGGEKKDANDNDFVTQVDIGNKAEEEKITAIKRPKRFIKLVDKFTPTKKKKIVQKTV
ncbi:hypothetical protein PanWU01x14_340120, partial [Parasponia andersonii]